MKSLAPSAQTPPIPAELAAEQALFEA